jgi:hypothetical protein
MIQVLDLSKAIPAGLVAYPHVVRAILPDVAEAARTEIARLAGQQLGTTAKDYTQGLLPTKFHKVNPKAAGPQSVATITLQGMLPNMIERGWGGGDLKPALLSGRSAKTAADGTKYAVVPFSHGAAKSGSRNRPPMGSAYNPKSSRSASRMGVATESAARKLGGHVHRAAKKLSPTTSHPESGRNLWGGGLKAGHAPLLKAHHKSDIYSGMVRHQKTYKSATQSHYQTFRTVAMSQPAGWLHPGIEAHNLFPKADQYVQQVGSFLMSRALAGASKGGRHG